MIEVIIWWGNRDGDSFTQYLVDVGPRNDGYAWIQFCAAYGVRAIHRALTEFEHTHSECSINRIELRRTATEVLQP